MSVMIRFEHKLNETEHETGPFEYAELTYDSLRVTDGRFVAALCATPDGRRWCLEDDFMPELADREFTDICIYAAAKEAKS